MNRNRAPFIILAILLGAGTFYGFLRLFQLRFETGDVYPPYSSLRTDPLGTKILYDALADTSGYDVSRNFQDLDKIRDPAGATIILEGADDGPWPKRVEESVDALVKKGAHLVLTFLPVDTYERRRSGTPAPKKDAKKPGAKASPKGDSDAEEMEDVDLEAVLKRWGASVGYQQRPSSSGKSGEAQARSTSRETEAGLSWHSTLYFPAPSADWRVMYNYGAGPVILRRAYGNGSIVLAGDSYFLSNEAMKAERDPRLLAAVIGTGPRIIFDETHLGVTEDPGVATLIRKYNLWYLLGAIGVLAGLFAWESATPFLPPEPEEMKDAVAGKDSTSGFIGLLRRGIAPSRLMEVCVDQWKRSGAISAGKLEALAGRIDAATAQGSREPAASYRTISQLLAEKK